MESSGNLPTSLQGEAASTGSEQTPFSFLHAPGGLGELRPPLLRELTSLLRRATFPGHRGTLPPSIPEKQETLQQLLISTPEKLSSNQERWPSASFMGLCALMFSLEVLHGKY